MVSESHSIVSLCRFVDDPRTAQNQRHIAVSVYWLTPRMYVKSGPPWRAKRFKHLVRGKRTPHTDAEDVDDDSCDIEIRRSNSLRAARQRGPWKGDPRSLETDGGEVLPALVSVSACLEQDVLQVVLQLTKRRLRVAAFVSLTVQSLHV